MPLRVSNCITWSGVFVFCSTLNESQDRVCLYLVTSRNRCWPLLCRTISSNSATKSAFTGTQKRKRGCGIFRSNYALSQSETFHWCELVFYGSYLGEELRKLEKKQFKINLFLNCLKYLVTFYATFTPALTMHIKATTSSKKSILTCFRSLCSKLLCLRVATWVFKTILEVYIQNVHP